MDPNEKDQVPSCSGESLIETSGSKQQVMNQDQEPQKKRERASSSDRASESEVDEDENEGEKTSCSSTISDKEADNANDSTATPSVPNEVKTLKLASETRLIIDGYVYKKHEKSSEKIRWFCKFRNQECWAAVTTSVPSQNDGKLILLKEDHYHNHPPSPDAETEALDGRIKKDPDAASGGNYMKERHGYLDHPILYRKFLVKFLEKPEFKRKYIMKALNEVYTSLAGCTRGFGRVLECRKKVKRDLELLKQDPNAEITGIGGKSGPKIKPKFHFTRQKKSEEEKPVTKLSDSKTQQPSSENKRQRLDETEEDESDSCDDGDNKSKDVSHKADSSSRRIATATPSRRDLTDAQNDEKRAKQMQPVLPTSQNQITSEIKNKLNPTCDGSELRNEIPKQLKNQTVPPASATTASSNNTSARVDTDRADQTVLKSSSSTFQEKARISKIGNIYHYTRVDSNKSVDVGKTKQDANEDHRSKENFVSHQRQHLNSDNKSAALHKNQANNMGRGQDSGKMNEYVPMKIQDRTRNEITFKGRDERVPWNDDRRDQSYTYRNRNHFEPRRFDNSRNDFRRHSYSTPYDRTSNDRGYRTNRFNTFSRFRGNSDNGTYNRIYPRRENDRTNLSGWDRENNSPYEKKSFTGDVKYSERGPNHRIGENDGSRTFPGHCGFNQATENGFNNYHNNSRFDSEHPNRVGNYHTNEGRLSENVTPESASSQRSNFNNDQAWSPVDQQTCVHNMNQCGFGLQQTIIPRMHQQQSILSQGDKNLGSSNTSSNLQTKFLDGESTVSSESGYMSESLQNISDCSILNNIPQEIIIPSLIGSADQLEAAFNEFNIPTLQSLEHPTHGVSQNITTFQHPDRNIQQFGSTLSSVPYATSSPNPATGRTLINNVNVDSNTFKTPQTCSNTQDSNNQHQNITKASTDCNKLTDNIENLNSCTSNAGDPEDVVLLRKKVERLENELLEVLRQDLQLARAELFAAEV
ncbi:hypothetical protein QAD02_006761 [Eretmocerus hayati]|uniref:Uncharacterized protein n=1 Tax=Eretmocerus hayati TaxID=131215 RepID=A0ACC2N233_9HYME|nr:hypothetical protein QAD02_006761 [Eretmocerus hayati]